MDVDKELTIAETAENMVEKRQYTRLESIFPVEIRAVSSQTGEEISGLIQGFTRDVSDGGLCLEVNTLDDALAMDFATGKAKVAAMLNLPFLDKPVPVKAFVAWIGKCRGDYDHRYIMGLGYDEIDDVAKRKIMRYAHRMRRAPWIITGIFTFFVIALLAVGVQHYFTRQENARLVDKLIDSSVERIELEDSLKRVNNSRRILEEELVNTGKKITDLENRLAKIEETKTVLLATRDALVQDLGGDGMRLPRMQLRQLEADTNAARRKLELATQQKQNLTTQLTELVSGKLSLEAALETAESTEVAVVTDTLHKMYQWVRFYQNPRTGLIRSYEGDPQVAGWAFTYDQALAIQCFMLFDDIAAARKVLDFYATKAEKDRGAFTNAYDVTTGAIAEFTAHAGPNIWLGISALQFYRKTDEEKYRALAEEIAAWTIEIQRTDPEGGLRGGRNIEWFSTEHNLDACAFFNMLHKVTGKRQYFVAAERTLGWIQKYAQHTTKGRLNRGKGDATIATDTLAWAIAALGPEKLIEYDMDPNAILDFAEEHCRVTTDYRRVNGERIVVTGFDFTKKRNDARGGIISSEWTAQMIVSYRIMESFYAKKGDRERMELYRDRARFYLQELQKLILVTPSKSGHPGWALPYATQEDVDTGHGWRTARGASTGSASGTIYAIFARLRYNPLMLNAWPDQSRAYETGR